jgi:ABC-2 type transport system permease protein
MFPYRGMPEWAQWFGEIFPLTHILRIIRAVMLKGANLSEIGFEVSILGVFILAYAALALLRFRRTLD